MAFPSASSRRAMSPKECPSRPPRGRTAAVLFLCLSLGHLSGLADGLLPLEFGPWKIGGAIRFGHVIKDYDDSTKPWHFRFNLSVGYYF